MFNSEVYRRRREELTKKFHSGLLLFMGNEESPMNFKDNTYHFRQDSTFLYYFGISAPGLAAAIDINTNQHILFGNEMTIDEIVWMGRQETLKEKALQSGLELVRPLDELPSFLNSAKSSNRPVRYLPPYREANKIKLSQLLGTELFKMESGASVDFIKAVVAQRSIKDELEVEEIEKAVDLTVDMHTTAMSVARPGISENEVAAAIHQVALAHGGNLSYPIILTTHGEILHNHFHQNILKEGDLVLNDSGAETAMGYCGDLTRTFPAGKKFTARQKELYDIVLTSLNEASSKLKPGITFREIHFEGCKTLARGLKDVGLMRGDIEEAVAIGAHAMFFQCGIGHMMGLDVHDMEDLGEQYVGYSENLTKETQLFGLKSLRLGKALEPGFVLTVEPGIYIIPELIDRWKAEKKFEDFINYNLLESYRDFGGIRIEDNYLITSQGARLLGKPLAKASEEVEKLREKAY